MSGFEVVAGSAAFIPGTDFVLVIRWWAPEGSDWRPWSAPLRTTTFETLSFLSLCCMKPVTRHCRAGAVDVYVCRCGEVATLVPESCS